jgi:hypothetical protein
MFVPLFIVVVLFAVVAEVASEPAEEGTSFSVGHVCAWSYG